MGEGRHPMSAQNHRLLVVGPSGNGGIDRFVERQAALLAGRYDVTVHRSVYSPTGTTVTTALSALISSLGGGARLPTRRRPDLVHVHTAQDVSFYRASIYVHFVSQVWNCPILLHIHGPSFEAFLESASRPMRRIQSSTFAHSDGIVVLSDHWREVLEPHVDVSKLHVVPNAVDPNEYDPCFEPNPPNIAFVSNLIDRKGVRQLLDAVERLRETVDREFEVTIAGRGPLAGTVETFAANHSFVSYRGYVPDAEKRALLDEASIFALPTHAEGLPIVLLEAMAGGNAIVSTSVGGIPELVSRENGLLISPGDVDGLERSLRALVTSPERTAAMGRTNRALVRSEYSWPETVDRLGSIYDRLLS